jgi:hypothetical protein
LILGVYLPFYVMGSYRVEWELGTPIFNLHPPSSMASMILPWLALVAGNTFPYTLLGIGAASLTVYAANCQTPSYKLGRVKDAIIATEKIRQHAEANGVRDQVKWLEYGKRLLE